ncbi:CAP domain-containing protein [Anaerotignum sp.]|uniref:CAP domain-containing protein n=1 Tax=Anaerotignum sp. TaxID=2039241 RepID=UPI002714E193|nr:CAP domain-containing protein [Anaerotignum sp.]
MKKLQLFSAVSVAVVSMSVQAIAMPLDTNAYITRANCLSNAALKNCALNSCQDIESIKDLCLNSVDVKAILNNLNCSDKNISVVIPNFNCDLNVGSGDTSCVNENSDCTGADCVDNSVATNDSTNETTTNETTTNETTTNETTTNETTTNETTTNETTTNETTTNETTTNETTTNETTTNGNTVDTSSSVSAYAQQVVDLVNAERAKAGLSPLQLDLSVTKAAQVRAKEIQSSFSHTRPDGRSCFTALDEAGVSYRGAGENIALGQRTPEQVMNDWMNSDGHRRNIMNPNFKYIGVGVDGNAWTQLFTY